VSLLISFNLSFLRPDLPIEAMSAWNQAPTLQLVPELLPFVGQLTVDLRCNKQLTSRLCTMGAELEARANSPSLGALTFAKAQLSLLLLEVVQAFEQPLVAAAAQSQRGITTSNRIDELLAFSASTCRNALRSTTPPRTCIARVAASPRASAESRDKRSASFCSRHGCFAPRNYCYTAIIASPRSRLPADSTSTRIFPGVSVS
jgi:hypothetical protein